MQLKTITLTNASGLHTRPGTKFVQEAKKFTCEVSIKKGEQQENAKSLIKLLKVGISQGDTITLITDGPDELEAVNTLAELLTNLSA